MVTRPAARIVATLALALAATAAPVTAQEPARAKGRLAPATKPVELNSATVEELAELPGVGPVTAKKIVAGRPYKVLDDLVPAGVPLRTVERIKPMVSIRPPKPKLEDYRAKAEAEKSRAVAEKAKSEAAGAKAEAEKAEATKVSSQKPVDLNTADAATLETLPGIGTARAKAIIAGRPYKTVDDLDRIKGLGPAKIAAIRDLVAVGPAAPAPAPAPVVASPAPAAPAPRAAEPPAPRATTTARAATTPKAATAPKLAPGQKVDLNTASKAELDALPGIGPVKAQAIIDGRPFKTIDEIKRVKGIKDVEFGKIRDIITVR